MASRLFKPSRVLAVALILGAAGWIASGELGPQAQENAGREGNDPPREAVHRQKVGVRAVTVEQHSNISVVSCVTDAQHRAFAVARGAGLIEELKVTRGQSVRKGDLIALVSDEGRQAALAQAEALLLQRQAEYDANKRLIETGNAPRNNLPALEAGLAAAKSAVAAAQAEIERVRVIAPWDGIIDNVPVQLGSAVQAGTQIVEIVGPDPMMAVGSVTERLRSSLRVGQEAEVRFIDGSTARGTVGFVSLTASQQTRTYQVEVRMENKDARIPDGVTCELAVTLDPVPATPVPRSALVFSDDGRLGVRVVGTDDTARFVAVSLVDDQQSIIWVGGLDATTRLIVTGQDFIKDGDTVEATEADARAATPEPGA